MSFIDHLKTIVNETTTTNGDIAYHSTFNANLDFFGSAGSTNVEDTVNKFLMAYYEDPQTAIKNLMFLRDIKNGEGKRFKTREILKELIALDAELVIQLLPHIKDLGRWDDILVLTDVENEKVNTAIYKMVKDQLQEDFINMIHKQPISLLAKWAPTESSKNAATRARAHRIAKHVMNQKHLPLRMKEYRKLVSSLRQYGWIVETNVTEKDYTFDYNKVPGGALLKYNKAFKRNDEERFQAFVNKPNEKKLSKKVDKLYPHEIVKMVDQDPKMANKLWDALPRPAVNKKTIVVLDTSGSMWCAIPNSRTTYISDVARSLAIYASELLTGPFKDKVITFSGRPKFISLKGQKTLESKVNYLDRYNEIANTNIEKTYNLIFKASKNCKEDEYIDNVLILSDMQFDCGATYKESTYDTVKEKFEEAGIPFPKMIYWNLSAYGITFPTTDIANAQFVSGYSKNLLKSIMESNELDAVEFMMDVLNKYTFVDEIFEKLKEN